MPTVNPARTSPSVPAHSPKANEASSPAAATVKALTSHGYNVDNNGIAGAYFRKVMTNSSVNNKGLRGVGVLPTVSFDPTRQYVSPNGLDDFKTGPLDRPSVYMGGHAGGNELDCGLSWDRVYDAQKRPVYTDKANGSDGRDPAHRFVRAQHEGKPAVIDGNGKVVARGADEVASFMRTLKPDFAFRPYWRTTGGGNNTWHNPAVGSPQNLYFYPGEKFTMTVQEGGPNKVRMDIRLEDSVAAQHFAVTFDQAGFGVGKAQSFKRINSADQFRVVDGVRKGNERQGVIPTTTTCKGSRWDEVTVLRRDGKNLPLTGSRYTEVRGRDMARRYGEVFKLSGFTSAGGESLDLIPLH